MVDQWCGWCGAVLLANDPMAGVGGRLSSPSPSPKIRYNNHLLFHCDAYPGKYRQPTAEGGVIVRATY